MYKGNRKKPKPFHYDNLTAYIMGKYECRMAIGLEADDLMSIDQWARVKEGKLDTIICSRDKDLRITPGMHFGWPCGKQPQFGPRRVTEVGDLELKGGKKLVGTGLKFFYSQVLMGDGVDNIPGLPRMGPVKAYKALSECETEEDLYRTTASLYEGHYGPDWKAHMQEQCDLLWMVRELDEEGNPVRYVLWEDRLNEL